MWRNLLLIITLASVCYYAYTAKTPSTAQENTVQITKESSTRAPALNTMFATNNPSHSRLRAWLYQRGFDLNPQVTDALETIIQYTEAHQIARHQIVTLIDYSLPANQKRLWVFDLDKQEVLFHTYVSHGLKSGSLVTNYFSNRFNSRASSIGVYRTAKPYYGRHGLSLKLDGLDPGFNDNADSRAIVMHGGWYAEEEFIKKYGRAGRSWGCPAVPDKLIAAIINTIKDQSLLVIYYPSTEWFVKSKFLKHDPSDLLILNDDHLRLTNQQDANELEDVLFVQLQKKNKYHEHEAILVMPVDRYSTVFHTQAPLQRMLRRQIEQQEYIALSKQEFDHLLQTAIPLQDLYFVVPEIKMVRGYYATEMNKLDLGKIKTIQASADPSSINPYYTVYFDDQSALRLTTTHRFIRWLGL